MVKMRAGNNGINSRSNQILQLVGSTNFMTINTISETLKLSESTVRRDVHRLIEQNKLKRFHGGVSVQEQNHISFGIRHKTCIQEKNRIGQLAATLVVDNDFIYIGAGSTTFYFAQALAKREELQNVTIVTGTINIAACFIGIAPNFRVIMLGGILTDFDECMTSKMIVDSIKQLNFTKSFTGHTGVLVANGITANRLDILEVDEIVFERARERIVLVDHTKIGSIACMSFMPFEKISILVTDDHEESRQELTSYTGDKVKILLV